MRRAARVDENQSQLVAALRSAGCSVTLLHQVGEGCPDLLIGVAGVTGLAEVKDGAKSASRRVKTPAQVVWWREWRGGPVATITDIEGALHFAAFLKNSLPQRVGATDG